jgi:hypothetical protein
MKFRLTWLHGQRTYNELFHAVDAAKEMLLAGIEVTLTPFL